MSESITVKVCGDCRIFSANADTSGIEDSEAFLAEYIRRTDGYWMLTGDDDDPSFSHSTCPTCGALAGDRWTATLETFGMPTANDYVVSFHTNDKADLAFQLKSLKRMSLPEAQDLILFAAKSHHDGRIFNAKTLELVNL